MKIAIIILMVLGMLNWSIDDEEWPIIRLLVNIATLICFLIFIS